MTLASTAEPAAGYTLAEVLAAIMVLGLTLGLAVEGARLITNIQGRVTTTVADMRTLRTVERALVDVLPSLDNERASFSGDGEQFSYDCSEATCGVSLLPGRDKAALRLWRGKAAHVYELPTKEPAKLVYETTDGRYDQWPLPDRAMVLRGVAVVTATRGTNPIVVARPWIEQSKTCEFDMIAKACRPPSRSATMDANTRLPTR